MSDPYLQPGATGEMIDVWYDALGPEPCPGCGCRHEGEHFDNCPLDPASCVSCGHAGCLESECCLCAKDGTLCETCKERESKEKTA